MQSTTLILASGPNLCQEGREPTSVRCGQCAYGSYAHNSFLVCISSGTGPDSEMLSFLELHAMQPVWTTKKNETYRSCLEETPLATPIL